LQHGNNNKIPVLNEVPKLSIKGGLEKWYFCISSISKSGTFDAICEKIDDFA